MTPRPCPETFTFDQISGLLKSPNSFAETFHLFGLFIREDQNKANVLWNLRDETISGDIQIKICGDVSQYLKPEPGDIIRLHRAKIDHATQMVICLSHKNIVLWKAYRYKPEPQSTAVKPTITPEDDKRRISLETFHLSNFTPIQKISFENQNNSRSSFPCVFGRVEAIGRDDYQNILLLINDGTGSIELRIFPKKIDFEDNCHFAVALELSVGDFVAATNTKINLKPFLLNLSASTAYGRSLRKLEQSSVLGVHLAQKLKDMPLPTIERSESPNASNPSSQSSSCQGLRRSPRLLGRQPSDHGISAPSAKKVAITIEPVTANLPSANHPSSIDSSSHLNQGNSAPITRLGDIKFCDGFRYLYCNIVGQVRSVPRVSRYGNLIFQIYDGTKPSFPSELTEEIPDPMADCATIIAYCPQAAQDTMEHYQKVQKLHEGDLIKIINLKIVKRNEKIRLELQANKTHDKSIEVISKNSEEGIRILDIVENPLVEELMEDYLYSTPPTEYSDLL